MGKNFYYATICENGHVLDFYIKDSSKYCTICGSKTFSQCTSCNELIQGVENFGIPTAGKRVYNAPYYCHNCGQPYPWTKKILDSAVELLSLDENLDDESKDIIRNAIPDLIVENTSTPLSVARYKKYMSRAEQFIKDAMYKLLVDVVSSAVKQSLFG